jgi:hypothetical protein
MRVKILRGVSVGVGDDAKEGDIRDLDPATADYLKNIGAAEDAPPEVAAEPEAESVQQSEAPPAEETGTAE